jgi:hypothetical protein
MKKTLIIPCLCILIIIICSCPELWPEEPVSGKIVFISFRDGNSEIYIMNPDGGGTDNISDNSAWDDWNAVWVP